MTPNRFLDYLSAIGWSQRELAHRLGYSSATVVNRWARGDAWVPADVAAWLEMAATWLADNPPPGGRQ